MHCISLLSDFGSNSSSISKIKGVLLQQIPSTQLIDVSHHVSTNNVAEAAYLTLSNYKFYPQNSIHLILIGLFQGKPPAIILHKAEGHYFISADNDIIPSLFEKEAITSYKIATLEKGVFITDWIKAIIPICQAIQSNTIDLANFPVIDNNSKSVFLPSFAKGNTLDCHVLFIDAFGNIIINFTKREWEENWNKRNFTLTFSRTSEIHEISTDYHTHEPGSKICRFNEAGFLEIVQILGHAANTFGLSVQRKDHLIYSTLKLQFK